MGNRCAVTVYLLLANLDYVGYWHDEAPTAVIGKNLLEQGDIVGWDGRNLVGGTHGRTLNADLRDTFPPLMYLLNAIGFWLFGYNEIGARGVHAFLGILALGFLFLLLRDFMRDSPRLLFFCFLFSAFSAQLLLFFRQSRYYAASILLLIASFYLYRRFWHSKQFALLACDERGGHIGVFQSLHHRGGVCVGGGELASVVSLSRYDEAGMVVIGRQRSPRRARRIELPLLDWVLRQGRGA